MIIGFSTERAAEYMVLHDMYMKIKDKYAFFYPFFYQKNRDDTHLSTKNNIDKLHLLICFARRPKTDFANSKYVAITFRQSLFEHTKYFSTLGISTVVGAPIGTSIDQIGFGSQCCWFQLNPTYDNRYAICEFIDGKPRLFSDDFANILNVSNLIRLLNQTPKYSWIEVLSIIHEWDIIYKRTHPTALFNTIPGQKPVFIVFK